MTAGAIAVGGDDETRVVQGGEERGGGSHHLDGDDGAAVGIAGQADRNGAGQRGAKVAGQDEVDLALTVVIIGSDVIQGRRLEGPPLPAEAPTNTWVPARFWVGSMSFWISAPVIP